MFHTVSVWLQGIVLVSPGIDAERNLMLNVLEKLQSIALMICPNARIVPSPPFEKCTNLPELVPTSPHNCRLTRVTPYEHCEVKLTCHDQIVTCM